MAVFTGTALGIGAIGAALAGSQIGDIVDTVSGTDGPESDPTGSFFPSTGTILKIGLFSGSAFLAFSALKKGGFING